MVHVPGRLHKTSDATSRAPVSDPEQEVLMLSTIYKMDVESNGEPTGNINSFDNKNTLDMSFKRSSQQCIGYEPTELESFIEGIGQASLSNVYSWMDPAVMNLQARAVTWETVKEESSRDKTLVDLAKLIEDGYS